MNSYEAYAKLGLAPGASEKDIDVAFRKQAAKLHPDVNKASTAEEEFKALNEAYQFLKKHHGEASTTRPTQPDDYFNLNVEDIMDAFRKRAYENIGFRSNRPHIKFNRNYTTIRISFAESVIGCVKEVRYQRKMVCATCRGSGYVDDETGRDCEKCHGKGSREHDDKELPCTGCKGTGKVSVRKLCHECHGAPLADKPFAARVQVPAGVSNGATITLRNKGDISNHGFYNDAYIKIIVEPDDELRQMGKNVVSSVKLSLLEALTGTTKDVRTVKGMKTLKIPGPRRHGDQMEAEGLGFPPNGKHVFFLDVEYPENIHDLVQFLSVGQKADGYIDSEGGTTATEDNRS
jgi:molecular chaperone DnaJ